MHLEFVLTDKVLVTPVALIKGQWNSIGHMVLLASMVVQSALSLKL